MLMRLILTVLISIPVSLCWADDPCEQRSPEEMAAEVGVKLPRRPWHLANIWWELDSPTRDFNSLSMDITIDRDVPETYNLYISPCGIAQINGLKFYGGIQTNINGWPNKTDQKRVHRGKGAIFSRWSADEKTPIGLDHVQVAAANCLVESAGYEGEFASVRRPFVWSKGTYTWQITKGETTTHKDKPATWFHCSVRDHASDDVFPVGSLLFEGEKFSFWGRHSAFVEVYSTAKIPKSNIPKVNVTFGWPRINGKKVGVKKASAFYPSEKTGITSSPDCAHVVADGENCRVEVGPIFKRDESKRRHELTIKRTESNR